MYNSQRQRVPAQYTAFRGYYSFTSGVKFLKINQLFAAVTFCFFVQFHPGGENFHFIKVNQ